MASEKLTTANQTNAFLQTTAPWTLSKSVEDKEDANYADTRLRVDRIIFQCAESLRLAAILLLPVMPSKMNELCDVLGVSAEQRTFAHAQYCADTDYGEPLVAVGRGHSRVLFPPLASEA